jgi:hypothetical protein
MSCILTLHVSMVRMGSIADDQGALPSLINVSHATTMPRIDDWHVIQRWLPKGGFEKKISFGCMSCVLNLQDSMTTDGFGFHRTNYSRRSRCSPTIKLNTVGSISVYDLVLRLLCATMPWIAGYFPHMKTTADNTIALLCFFVWCLLCWLFLMLK